ncbi:MAG: hypothetical protein ACE5JG_02800 [Planctomycetota bacterium]
MRVRACLVAAALAAAAGAQGQDITLDRDGEDLVVRSPASKWNFLFRLPAAFRPPEKPAEHCLVHLEAAREQGEASHRARVFLRLRKLTAEDARKGVDALARRKAAERPRGLLDVSERRVSGTGLRRRITCEGSYLGDRIAVTWLLVQDGSRLYELHLDQRPPGSVFDAALKKAAEGFTLLEPRQSAPREDAPLEEAQEARTVTHDYWRVTVLKPAGFVQESIDGQNDPGILFIFRRRDEHQNLCTIRVRARLRKVMKKSVSEKADLALERFRNRFVDVLRAPRKPPKTRWPGAKEAYRLQLVARENGLPFREDHRFVDHQNGRVYEFQVTTWAGADREFKKELRAFWKSVKIETR